MSVRRDGAVGMTPEGGPSRFCSSRENSMTLDEAVAAVEATFGSASLRVDRRRPMEDQAAFLLVVLDVSGGRREGTGVVANGPHLVDKRTGTVTRLTVPDARARAERMTFV
jgi:hypothetical protein